MKLTIELTDEEAAEMNALAIRYGKPPTRLVSAFVADLTESLRSNGSDERILAGEYVARAHMDRIEHGRPENGDALTEEEQAEYDRLRMVAYGARERQKAEWRAEYEAKQAKTLPSSENVSP